MRLAKGPRPWTIWAFAIGFIALGLIDYVTAIASLEEALETLRLSAAGIDWNQDLLIVWYSALLSIVLIPVIAIWLFASRTARWIVTAMSAISLLNVLLSIVFLLTSGRFEGWSFTMSFLSLLCVALLFAPASNRWLRKEEMSDAATFE